jgi:hypothetical protein
MKYLQIILIISIFSACQDDHGIAKKISFYHWGSKWNPNQTELNLLQQTSDNSSGRIYLHLFDLKVIEGKVQKVSSLELVQPIPQSYCAIPVVYIENKVFEIPDDSLASKVYEVISRISMQQKFCANELQIDCDWTETTKEAYFLFLKKIKEVSNWKITATIRLHQVKFYKRTGIPPVDKGVLMYYNMGKITGDNRNSILDNQIGEQYLDNFSTYPLALDIALPCYHWWIQLRDGIPIELLTNLKQEPSDKIEVFEAINEGLYKVRKSGFYAGYYLKEGDLLKLEESEEDELIRAAKTFKKRIHQPFEEVIFFELDSTHISSFDASLFSSFVLHDSTSN